MPRRSAAALAIAPGNLAPTRLQPPSDLPTAERAIWTTITGSCRADHFVPSDGLLLRRYVETLVLARAAAEAVRKQGAVVDGKLSPELLALEKLDKSVLGLTRVLRLAPQQRQRIEDTKPGLPPSPYEGMA